jgi:hypothetical protein
MVLTKVPLRETPAEWFNDQGWDNLLMFLRARKQELLEKLVTRPDDRIISGRVAEIDRFLDGTLQKRLTGEDINE